MAKKNNRKCICCSEEYTYCGNCSEDRMKAPWHAIYHNTNCKDIFNAASDYLAGALTKEEAKEQFDKCDLSYKAKLHHKIIEAIDDVYGVVTPIVEEKFDKSVVVEAIIEEEKEIKKVNKKKVVFE